MYVCMCYRSFNVCVLLLFSFMYILTASMYYDINVIHNSQEPKCSSSTSTLVSLEVAWWEPFLQPFTSSTHVFTYVFSFLYEFHLTWGQVTLQKKLAQRLVCQQKIANITETTILLIYFAQYCFGNIIPLFLHHHVLYHAVISPPEICFLGKGYLL